MIQAARLGDDFALNQIWQQLRSYLVMFAHQRLDEGLSGKLDASDVVQQSLLEAYRDFNTFQGQSEGEIRAWTCRLVLHNILDAGRKYRQSQKRSIGKEVSWTEESELAVAKSEASASSLVRRRETDDELLQVLAQLPARSQQVVELRHRWGLSHAQVAAELGMTENAARKLWSRIVEELRERLSSKHATYSARPG